MTVAIRENRERKKSASMVILKLGFETIRNRKEIYVKLTKTYKLLEYSTPIIVANKIINLVLGSNDIFEFEVKRRFLEISVDIFITQYPSKSFSDFHGKTFDQKTVVFQMWTSLDHFLSK